MTKRSSLDSSDDHDRDRRTGDFATSQPTLPGKSTRTGRLAGRNLSVGDRAVVMASDPIGRQRPAISDPFAGILPAPSLGDDGLLHSDDGAGGVSGDPLAGMGLTMSADDDARLAARTNLVLAAAEAHELILKLRAGRVTAAAAAVSMKRILTGRNEDVAVLAANHQRVRRAGDDPARKVTEDVTRAIGGAPDAGDEAAARDDAAMRPVAIASLDALVGDALEIARALGDGAPEVRPMLQVLDGVTRAAAPLDWAPPADLSTARDRKLARVACPAGENDESPQHCTLTDGERADRRATVIRTLTTITATIFKQCKSKAADLQAELDADEKFGELVATFVVDTLITAVIGAAGVPGAKAAKAAKDAGIADDTSEARKAFDKFVVDLRNSAVRTTVTRVPKARGAGTAPDAPERRTIGALDALAEQMKSGIAASIESLEALDDRALFELEGRLTQYQTSQIADQVRTFAEAYRTQVAPIGIERPDSGHLFEGGGYRADMRATGRAVRIAMPMGEPRLALVDELTENHPTLAKAARTVAVAGDRVLGDGDDTLIAGSARRVAQDAWIDQPGTELHFIRWIDDPRMQRFAGDDAPTVPAARVVHLPLRALAGVPAADE